MLFTLIFTVSSLQAETKRYEVESGIIEYTLNGSGDMMGMQTKTVGKSKILFKEWGNVELREDSVKSVIMGREEETHQTTKIENGKVFVVDYAHHVIVEYDPRTLMQSEHKDLVKSSKEMILSMGGIKKGGSGCICPESALLRALVMHIVLARDEVVVMDMEAGIEHCLMVMPGEKK